MPTVTELQLFAVDLPFKVAFKHAAASRTTSESLFLRVGLDSGAQGWGESLPRAYVSGEHREGAFALLRDAILPGLLGRTFQSLAEVGSFLEKFDLHQCECCGDEFALPKEAADAAGRLREQLDSVTKGGPEYCVTCFAGECAHEHDAGKD